MPEIVEAARVRGVALLTVVTVPAVFQETVPVRTVEPAAGQKVFALQLVELLDPVSENQFN
jgi:hypothetical protein